MPAWVSDRQVYINTQTTQTVKICTADNERGKYEKYYRIFPPNVLSQQEMIQKVSQFSSIPELEDWLCNNRKAEREFDKEETLSSSPPSKDIFPKEDKQKSEHVFSGVVGEILDLIDPKNYSSEHDTWILEAKILVENAIDTLIQEFMNFPYLHRVEHSIHACLYSILTANKEFSSHYPLGECFGMTQLVHKEWPETVPRTERERRGNFDLAILSPTLLRSCSGIDMFLEGRLAAPFVIEMGLDYGAKHLAEDAQKLINSKPQYGYLIHLVRDARQDFATEQIILNLEKRTGIRTAYARIFGGYKAYKLINDTHITEE